MDIDDAERLQHQLAAERDHLRVLLEVTNELARGGNGCEQVAQIAFRDGGADRRAVRDNEAALWQMAAPRGRQPNRKNRAFGGQLAPRDPEESEDADPSNDSECERGDLNPKRRLK